MSLNPTSETDFLKHVLDVIRIGDQKMLDSLTQTIRIRIERLQFEKKMPEILDDYQNRIDNRIKNLLK